MSRHDIRITLTQMLSHAEEAIQYADGKTRSNLDSDRLLGFALVRLIEIVGEAATRVPAERRESWPQIPWAAIIGTRNQLAHGYDSINFDIVWTIIQDGLPDLVREVKLLLASDDLR